MNHLLLTRERLDVGAINDLVCDDSCGAISLFVGTTRDNFDSKKVLSLEYEAYEPMAVKQMQAICEELRGRWPDAVHIAFYHRLGLVPVREASVVIAVSSPHRRSALEAVDFAIEELKRRVPIWKKEKYDNDESAWKENKESPTRPKRPKLNFTRCDLQDMDEVPSSLVQIAAEECEISRRIQCFVEKKREEIDLNNILDFSLLRYVTPARVGDSGAEASGEETLSTCARTNSIVVKQENSKCHLRVRRVENHVGPQTRPDYAEALDKLMTIGMPPVSTKTKQKYHGSSNITAERAGTHQISDALQERLVSIEQHLHLPATQTSKHAYERLKAIENRILYLESLSPEYKHFLTTKTIKTSAYNREFFSQESKSIAARSRKRKTYTAQALDAIIEGMQDEHLNSNDSDGKDEDKLHQSSAPHSIVDKS